VKTLKVAFSGPAGCGKSTMISILQSSHFIKELEAKIGEIEFLPEVVRTLRAQHNFGINEFGSLETELVILSAHVQNLFLKDRFVTDRCLVDNYLYSTLNTVPIPYQYREFNEWLVGALLSRYDVIFYIPNEFVPPEDGVRNISSDYHKQTQEAFETFYTKAKDEHPCIIRLTGDITTRFKKIESTLKDWDLIPY